MDSDWKDYVFNWKVRVALPAVIFVLATAFVLRYIYSRPVVFESTAKVWIQTKVSTNSLNQGVSPFFNSPISTAAEVMRSSVVLNEAIKELGSILPPGDVPSLAQLRTIKITPIVETDVLEVIYQHANPKIAYESVKAILNAFVQVSTTQSSGSAVQSRLFLQKQLSATKQQHEAVTKAIREFQESSHSIDVTQESETLLSQIAKIKDEMRDAQVELGTIQSRVKSLVEQLGMSPESAIAADKISQDEVLQQLREKLTEYQVKLVDVRGRYTDDSARAIRLKKSIERTEKAINDRILAEYGSLPITADKLPTGKADKREKILDQLSTARHDEAAAKQKVAELQSSLAKLSAGLRPIPFAKAKFSDLARAEKVSSEGLSEAERNLSAAQLNEEIAHDTSNVQVIDMPEIASKPESANGKKIFAIAEVLLLVICSGIFYILYYFDPHLYSPKKLSKIIPAQIAGGLGPEVFARSLASIPVLHGLRLTIQDWIGLQPIAVLGPGRGDGKTSVACGLALSYVATGKRVLLLDADFGNPAIHKLFDVPESPGLSDFVRTRNLSVLHEALRIVKPNLFVITAGAAPDSIIEGMLLDELLGFAKSHADVVIFDTALGSSDSTLALLASIKKALVVARLGHTRISPTKALATCLASKNVAAILVPTNVKESDVVAARAEQSIEQQQAELTTATW